MFPAAVLVSALLVAVAGCAGVRGGAAAGASTTTGRNAVHRVEMEPMAIEAVGRGPERRVEAYDAATLFEQAGADLQAERWDAAAAGYDRLVAKFPDSRYVVAALYNAGLALEGRKDWAGAVARYRVLVERHGETRDALDGLFRMGQCLAELGNWAASAGAFEQVLTHADIAVEDRIEATARRGLAQYYMKDGAAAERTFREALRIYRDAEANERIDNVFFVAMSHYYLGELAHQAFRDVPVRLPERQMKKDLEAKAQQLLVAQGRYLDVARLRNPAWSTAAGYQMASLYKEFYDAVMEAPTPREVTASEEVRRIYFEELRKTIEPLLRKAIHMHELTQQLAEHNGIDNEWVRKSGEQLEQLRALVSPTFAPSDPAAPAGASPGPAAPPAGPRPPAPPPPPPPAPSNDGGRRGPVLM